jgi:hypothetical protein
MNCIAGGERGAGGFGGYRGRSSAGDDDEEFYGLDDFFKDLESEFKSTVRAGSRVPASRRSRAVVG